MLKTIFKFLWRCVVVSGPVIFKAILIMLANSPHQDRAKERALKRARDRYASSGYDDSYMPVGVEPEREDFLATKNSWSV